MQKAGGTQNYFIKRAANEEWAKALRKQGQALWTSHQQKGTSKYKIKTHKQRRFKKLKDTQMTTLGKENQAEKTIAKDLADLVVTNEDSTTMIF